VRIHGRYNLVVVKWDLVEEEELEGVLLGVAGKRKEKREMEGEEVEELGGKVELRLKKVREDLSLVGCV
jgi:hypothetical protein